MSKMPFARSVSASHSATSPAPTPIAIVLMLGIDVPPIEPNIAERTRNASTASRAKTCPYLLVSGNEGRALVRCARAMVTRCVAVTRHVRATPRAATAAFVTFAARHRVLVAHASNAVAKKRIGRHRREQVDTRVPPLLAVRGHGEWFSPRRARRRKETRNDDLCTVTRRTIGSVGYA